MMMKNKIILFFLCVVSLLLQGCGGAEVKRGKPVVTVSLEPQRFFLDKIVGDKMQVNCLLRNGDNPESYEPSMNDLMAVEESEAYIKMGNVGFEQVLIGKLRQNNTALKVYDCSKGIEFIMGTHDCGGHHDHGHSHDAEADPHTWTSVKNAKIIARNMLDAVIEVDSANADYYSESYRVFVASLDSLDAYAARKLSGHKGEAFLVWHPSLSYFARDYGLEQVTIGQIGKELSAKQLQGQIDNARNHKACVFFSQQEFDSHQVDVLNEQIGAEKVTINPLSYDWETEIRRIVDAIAAE